MLAAFAAVLLVNLLPVAALHAADGIVVLPTSIHLTGPAARQRLLVETQQRGQITGQLTSDITWKSSNPDVVTIENGIAVPTGDGEAEITAVHGSQTATVTVQVKDFTKPHQWSFRNHVQSVFSKTGCNSGACHGALAGKNGFKLSLRGYDPETDFHVITRQSRGRRIVPSDPGRSLLLTKPSGAIPHKGGLRFEVDSPEYRIIAEWLASGHPGPSPDDARIERLEILPDSAVLKNAAQQQLIVLAHFSDSHVEDVTHLAKYTSTNDSVSNVGERGEMTVTGYGEGAIVAWYLSQNVIATISVPHDNDLAPETFTAAARSGFIDELVLAKLQSLNIPPSPLCSDAEFLRRAYLDTLGVLPTAEQVRNFLADNSPEKRDKLADELLSRPEYIDYWAYQWSDLLLVTGDRLRPKAVEAYYQWIRQRVADNTPWDEFARGIVTAKGGTFENGAANFYSLHQDAYDMAETVSMAFLGMSIQCAKCHDHPLEKWTNDDYFGMANLFSRVRGKGWGGDFRSGDGDRVIFTTTEGELIQPRTGRPQLPRPLDGEAIPFDATTDRREHLADWLTSPDNPYFSRAITNRIWANFLGVGIVENVDDLRLTNPASNAKLLSALADHLVANKYDVQSLMREILKSKTYQRSSQTLPANAGDKRFYSRFYPRRLKAEVLLDVVSQATGVPTKFQHDSPKSGKKEDLPLGTRALQLPDASIESAFLETFGRPERIITCECERSDEPSMVQVLHIVNGDTLNDKLAAKDNLIDQLLATGKPNYRIIEDLYLSSLGRFPTDTELAAVLQILNEAGQDQRRLAYEDLYWGILSSREFLFNH